MKLNDDDGDDDDDEDDGNDDYDHDHEEAKSMIRSEAKTLKFLPISQTCAIGRGGICKSGCF